jgi:hypothetical protein
MIFGEDRKLVRNLSRAEKETREILIREFLRGDLEPSEYIDAIEALYQFGVYEATLFEFDE